MLCVVFVCVTAASTVSHAVCDAVNIAATCSKDPAASTAPARESDSLTALYFSVDHTVLTLVPLVPHAPLQQVAIRPSAVWV